MRQDTSGVFFFFFPYVTLLCVYVQRYIQMYYTVTDSPIAFTVAVVKIIVIDFYGSPPDRPWWSSSCSDESEIVSRNQSAGGTTNIIFNVRHYRRIISTRDRCAFVRSISTVNTKKLYWIFRPCPATTYLVENRAEGKKSLGILFVWNVFTKNKK